MPDFDTTNAPGAQIRIATAKGGKTDVALTPKEVTWPEFCDTLSRPKVGPKDGPYYIRGGNLSKNSRADDNLIEADLLIIDGDSRFDPETGEITSGAPPLDEAKAALDDIGLTYCAHTTHSFRPEADFWKYRIIVPAHMRSPAELEASVEWLMAQLHARGVYLVDVNEQHKWAQPWYAPRVATEAAAAAFQHHRNDGKAFDVAAAVAWAKRQHEGDATIKRAQQEQPKRDPKQPSVISDYNDSASLADVRAILERHGYKFAGRKGDTYRYISPTSESGTAGVVIFKGKLGHWCTYSFHGAHDPLSNKVCDPFELLAMFEYGGDHKKAVRGISPAKGAAAGVGPGFDAGQGGDKPKGSRFQWIDKNNGSQPVLDGNWLVKKTIPAEGMGVIFGRPGSGKTFTVMDVALHIANGIPWRGIKTERAAVSYITPEGGRMGVNRVLGWCGQYGLPWPDNFRLSPVSVNLCSTDEDAAALIADIKANQPDCGMVAIDTLNRAMAGGDENSGEDMGRFVALCERIAREVDCFVLVVHHSGKDAAKGSRGHSSLLGALNMELEVTREQGADAGVVRVSKLRDAEDGAEFVFSIVSFPLGIDKDGDEVTTGVSVPVDGADAERVKVGKAAQPSGKAQLAVAAAFSQYIEEHGKPNPAGVGFPEYGRYLTVEVDAFIKFAAGKFAKAKPYENAKEARRVVEDLTAKRYFCVNSGLIWKTG